MRRLAPLTVFAALIALSVLCAQEPRPPAKAAPQTWEYRVVLAAEDLKLNPITEPAAFNERLNEFGRDGWQLGGTFRSERSGSVSDTLFVFQRPTR